MGTSGSIRAPIRVLLFSFCQGFGVFVDLFFFFFFLGTSFINKHEIIFPCCTMLYLLAYDVHITKPLTHCKSTFGAEVCLSICNFFFFLRERENNNASSMINGNNQQPSSVHKY